MIDAWRVLRGFLCLACIIAGWRTGIHDWWLAASFLGASGCFDAMPPHEPVRSARRHEIEREAR